MKTTMSFKERSSLLKMALQIFPLILREENWRIAELFAHIWLMRFKLGEAGFRQYVQETIVHGKARYGIPT